MDLKSLSNKLGDYISTHLEDVFTRPKIIEINKPDFNQGMQSIIYIVTMDYTIQEGVLKKRDDFIFKLYEGTNSKILFDPNLSAKSEYIFTKYLSKYKFSVPTIYAYEAQDNEIS